MSSLNNGTIPTGLIVDANTLLAQPQTSASNSSGNAIHNQACQVPQQILQQSSDAQQRLQTFWQKQMEEIQELSSNEFKTQELPLARIKKIMKMDEDVKMISAEAPLLFSKAAQIFITELSLRAWIHTEDSKRRTLQRNDIATAITKFDQFDFLIDIVPREELKPPGKATFGGSEQVQYFYTLPQQARTTPTINNSVASISQGSGSMSGLQTGQILLAQQTQNGQPMTLTPVNIDSNQILQIAQPAQQTIQQPTASTLLLNEQSSESLNQISQTQSKQQGDINQTQSQAERKQTTQALLQQLVSSIPNSSPGEVHSIQINSQGQLQLVKVANPQAQNVGDEQHMIATLSGSNRQTEGETTGDGSQAMDSIYVTRES